MIGGTYAFSITPGEFGSSLRSDSCSPRSHIFGPSNCPNSFPCHTSAKFTRNSFRCHTYKFALLQVLSLPHIQKTGGVPLGVRRSCRRFHARQLSAPNQPCQRGATTSPLFSHFTNLITFRSF